MLRPALAGDLSPRPVRVLSIPPSNPILVAFLGPYRGLLTHYLASRSLACPGAAQCPPLAHRRKVVWKGYAPVDQWDFGSELWIPAVLEISESLEHALVGHKLRGQVWVLSRFATASKGPCTGVHNETIPEEDLRPSFSIEAVLERFYHQSPLLLDVPNPVPARVLLEPRESHAPRVASEVAGPLAEPKPIDPETLARFREQLRSVGGSRKGGAT